MAYPCVKNYGKECDGCGGCKRMETTDKVECSVCMELFKQDELQHGMCPVCREATIDRLKDMVRNQFDEEERAVINEWDDNEAIGF